MREETKLLDGTPITKLMHGKRWEKLGSDGKPDYKPECDLEGEIVSLKQVTAEGTLGRYGPNGNGFNYWCNKCQYRCVPLANNYSALDNFFGVNQVKSPSGN